MPAYDQEWAENYARLASASIPGRDGLYQLCSAYFSNLPDAANILVVGCGTGEELIKLAQTLPTASFEAIDPAEPMLALCRERLGSAGLTNRVTLHATTLDHFQSQSSYHAATTILVSQHIQPDEQAQAFFTDIATRLRPSGLLFSADLHFQDGVLQESLTNLWQNNVMQAGIDASTTSAMLNQIVSVIQPRPAHMLEGFLENAGFSDIFMPFRSLMYGAWVARKA